MGCLRHPLNLTLGLSETAFKVHLPFWIIKLPKSSPWPTDYNVLALMMNCYELIRGHRYYIVLTCPVV